VMMSSVSLPIAKDERCAAIVWIMRLTPLPCDSFESPKMRPWTVRRLALYCVYRFNIVIETKTGELRRILFQQAVRR
jgi:hypothetical protein